jgi:O-antigen/teichoic acid export membrane protein
MTPLIDKIILVNLFSGAVVLFTLAASVLGSIVQLIDKSFMTKYINTAQKQPLYKFNYNMPAGILAYISLFFVIALLLVKCGGFDEVKFLFVSDYFKDLNLGLLVWVLIILSPLIFINSHNMLTVSILYKVGATRFILISGAIGFLFGSLFKYYLSNMWGAYGFGFGYLSYYLIIYSLNMFYLRRLKLIKK